MAKRTSKVIKNGVVTIKVQAGKERVPAYNWGKGYVVRGADRTGVSASQVEVTSEMLKEVFSSR